MIKQSSSRAQGGAFDAVLRVVGLFVVGIGFAGMPALAAPFGYISDGISNVLVIDTATNTVVATVPVGNRPQGVIVSPDGKHAYVANLYDATVSVIDTTSRTVVATIPVDITPDFILPRWPSTRTERTYT
jgi:YVTN family beta-propeller protein